MKNPNYPFITLTYAASLDGSICLKAGGRLALSGTPSLMMTHRLRAKNDGIMVGIGTILADNPRLTVRLVKGENPRPIIIDSKLRIPLDAAILSHPKKPWIITQETASRQKERSLLASGAEVIRAKSVDGRVDFHDMLSLLKNRGIEKLMVEGGSSVISSLIRDRLVDSLILTISPQFIGGLSAITEEMPHAERSFVQFHYKRVRRVGKDLVIEATIEETEPQ